MKAKGDHRAVSRRMARQRRTITAMIAIYCRGVHGTNGEMCAACQALLDYALVRLDRCPLVEHKQVCSRCPVQCFPPDKAHQVRQVMAYAGPRMLFRHPFLAVRHLFETVFAGVSPKRR